MVRYQMNRSLSGRTLIGRSYPSPLGRAVEFRALGAHAGWRKLRTARRGRRSGGTSSYNGASCHQDTLNRHFLPLAIAAS